jgi:molecular chaperone DnaK
VTGPAVTIGLDLGTTRSRVAVYTEAGARIVENAEGRRATPSAISFLADRRTIVGAAARRYAAVTPRTTVVGVKRLLGRAWESAEIQAVRATAAYDIVKAANGDAWVRIGTAAQSPPEVQAAILAKLAADAARELGAPIARAVIAVPAGFDEAQRRAVRDAGAIAGLDVLRLINEPTAAALAYGFDRTGVETIAVVDFGGGTCEASILRREQGLFEMLATAGDPFLGGDELDRRIATTVRDEVLAVYDVDLLLDPIAAQRLLDDAEAVKRSLSDLDEAMLALPNLAVSAGAPISVTRPFTRGEVEALAADLITRMTEICRAALADARVGAVDAVLAVGGMSRMPLVRRAIAACFGQEPAAGVQPDLAVAIGTAIESAVLDGRVGDVALVDLASQTIGVRASNDRFVPLIKRAGVIPARVRKVFATSEDDQHHVVVEVYQGEEAQASRNRLLSRFHLSDLPRGRRGEVHVEILFTVDAGGCFSITARDIETGQPCTVESVAGTGLSAAARDKAAAARLSP